MAHTVNAVTASAGDYYMYRPYGISVYEGQVMRWDNSVETCYITDTGDLVFSRIGELESWEEAQKFVDDNHIRFSVSFGPILVDNYENVVPKDYKLGEVDGNYSRGCIALLDDLHYLLVVANQGDDGWNSWKPTMIMFAEQVHSLGVRKAYALDGGQTCVIIANDKRISLPDYGRERVMSDILYFATAIPSQEAPQE
jgi:exopolysaccharide biosynthesis protein